jgi:hypothetical protein
VEDRVEDKTRREVTAHANDADAKQPTSVDEKCFEGADRGDTVRLDERLARRVLHDNHDSNRIPLGLNFETPSDQEFKRRLKSKIDGPGPESGAPQAKAGMKHHNDAVINGCSSSPRDRLDTRRWANDRYELKYMSWAAFGFPYEGR